jgi:DNA-3-methyladenine glycosylase II
MQRRWIGIDNSPESISTILNRFERGLLPMGDYVRKSEAKTDKPHYQSTLFDTLNQSSLSFASTKNTNHKPITDFTIFVDEGTSCEVRSIVSTWQQRNNAVYSPRQKIALLVSESPNLAKICYQLHAREKRLAKVINSIGPCGLVRGNVGFEFLVDAIIGQQLSKSAADTITKRFRKLFSSGRPTSRQFLSLPREKVREIGISRRKYDYILDLAQRVDTGQLKLAQLHQEDDATIRQMLKEVKGIGDWTVDMYLLFGLARLDVFPVHDLALRKVMHNVYGVEVNDLGAAGKIALKWMPYRGVASWYLYKFRNMKA